MSIPSACLRFEHLTSRARVSFPFFFAERKHASKTWTICFLYPSLHKQTREGRDAARMSESQESLKTPQWLCWTLCTFCSLWDMWSKINIDYLEDFLSASERWLGHFAAPGHRVLFWNSVTVWWNRHKTPDTSDVLLTLWANGLARLYTFNVRPLFMFQRKQFECRLLTQLEIVRESDCQ